MTVHPQRSNDLAIRIVFTVFVSLLLPLGAYGLNQIQDQGARIAVLEADARTQRELLREIYRKLDVLQSSNHVDHKEILDRIRNAR